MDKKLDLTEPIIAWLLEPDSSRAEVAAMLRDTGKRFELAVPFRGNFDKYQQWFLSSGTVVLNDKPLEPVELPSIIRTVSNGRFYTLVGCRVSGSVSAGTGTGIVVPTYVVFGTSETNFEKIHAMRSNIPGLSPWSGVSSLSLSFGDGSSKKTEVIAEPRNEIVIDESVGLKLRPDYSVRTSLKRDEVTARQMVSIETRTDELRDWTWHLFYHRSLMNLLTISDWVPRTFADLEVLRDEDSYELDGEKREMWHPVLSYMPRVDRSHFENPESQYLFCFSDIREEGIRKWLELVDRCQQGMTLLAYVAKEQEHLALETLNMLTGTMLDCIGWYVVKTKNQIKRMKRNSKTGEMQSAGFYQMLEAVQEELGGVFPFTNKEDWKRDMRKAFVGNKHGDAEGVDFQTMYDVTMESLVIARMWVGLQLGADGNTLKERVSSDEIGKRVSRFIAW
nr:hypothetical protein [Bifidobacterium catenulatum]